VLINHSLSRRHYALPAQTPCQVALDSWLDSPERGPKPVCTANALKQRTTRSRYNSTQQRLSRIHQALGIRFAQAL
jgi:hypothetical protein